MRNIQVYKTGADLKARKTERQRESERKHRVEIQQQLEIRTLESAADRAKENRQQFFRAHCVVLTDSESAIHIHETDETRRRSVHQRIQQTPRTAISAEVPGVSDREAGQ
ncbi:hypothetical protein E3U43_009646 [Larimichthys crocea]|uniref:Uncharacterized protein n=1 Tax=Larimichthys crocea TaxID=215358 RepID=A0ACD3QD33_LARCR|nr:hypothetical protein E3U43_009646 [Larimichthys crocea]